MGIRSLLSKPLAAYMAAQQKSWSLRAGDVQQEVFHSIIRKARDTKYGRDHQFAEIKNVRDFQSSVPIGDYEVLSPYVKMILEGRKDILWPGETAIFCKNIWHHFRHQVYSNHQRFDAEPHQ
jgi:hypothetical protein